MRRIPEHTQKATCRNLIILTIFEAFLNCLHHIRISHRVIHRVVKVTIIHELIIPNQSLRLWVMMRRLHVDVTGLRFGAFYNSKLFFLNSLNFLSVEIIIVDLHQELRREFVMTASKLVKLVWIAGFVSSGRFNWDF